MRSYITVVDGDIDLLPFFAKYYTYKLGVEEFYLLTFGTKEQQIKAYNLLAGYATKIVLGPLVPSNRFLAGTRDKIIKSVHSDGEWAFFTDMDEFPQIDTKTVIEYAKENKEDYVSGIWRDRVSKDGCLKKVERNEKIVDQFPMWCRTRQYLGLHANAYILSRHAPTSHHPSNCKLAKPYPPHRRYIIHHFKWTDTVIRRLRTRKQRVSSLTQSRSWVKSISRTIKMVQAHNGVPRKLLRKVRNDIDI